MTIAWQIAASAAFLAVNVVVLYIVLRLQRGRGHVPTPEPAGAKPVEPAERTLSASDILGSEFEYARITASEAMQDRHTMMNFYLLAVGVVISGVVGLLAGGVDAPAGTASVLLWLLCGIGWLYFLKIVRLRQAWYESVRAMNQIKNFYLDHSAGFDRAALQTAFRWKVETLPPPDKPWTIYFLSSTLIAYLDTAVYVAGGVLLSQANVQASPAPLLAALAALGLAFFGFHMWLYFALFR